ncbi:MAG: protein kinase [Anaerolineae bacterium]|nr:protein kinase [Anaerolineae bacterium]
MLSESAVLQERYRVVAPLRQGGMGAVYQAWDTRLGIPVALKEMLPQPGLDADTLDQLRQQFQEEAKTLARLNHPHLVRVIDYFQEAGNAYLVMDFIAGEGLDERIARDGALPESAVLEWGQQLLDALAYCHDQGIIHRDVKPQNVILRPDGRAVLVDFGLLKLWDPGDPRTKTAMRGMGTPEYAPPEQYDIGGSHTDPRTDVYSLGATLYHALTGQAPPTATQRIAGVSDFHTPRQLNPVVSPTTEVALLKALALKVNERFETARQMAAALAPAPPQAMAPLAQPTRVLPETQAAAEPRTGVPRWVWVAAGLLGVGIVIVALLAATGTFGGGGSDQPVVYATEAPATTEVRVEPTTAPESTPRPPEPTPVPQPAFEVVPTAPSPYEGLNALGYLGFNASRPPFDDVRVRRAFAAATDREALAAISREAFPAVEFYPATTMSSPDVIGANLYRRIGQPFEPDLARELLAAAGYPNGAGFPPIDLWFSQTGNGSNEARAEFLRTQWGDILGVEVIVHIEPREVHTEVVLNDPPHIWYMGWLVDYVDPQSVLHDAICGGYNPDFYTQETHTAIIEAIIGAPNDAERREHIAEYSAQACTYWAPTRFRWRNPEYDALLEAALLEPDANVRRATYIEAEQILCGVDVAVIPLYHYHLE